MASTKPAEGRRDTLPADVQKHDYVNGVFSEVCARYGFELMDGAEGFYKKLNNDDKSVESAAILAFVESLDRLGIKNFAIYLSHSDVLTGILETLRLPETLHQKTFPAIRNFNKYNIEGFESELHEVGVSENASTLLSDLFLKTDEILNQEHDVNHTVVGNLLNIVGSETLMELGQIIRLIGNKPVLIDPALPCESPFDHGIVIEARTSGLDNLGSGGCIKTADDSTLFAFSFEIENIVELMEMSNAFPAALAVSGPAAL